MVLLVIFIVSFYSELIAKFDKLMDLKCRVCLHLCTCLCLLKIPTITDWCGPHLLGLSGASGGDIGFPLTR